MSALCDASTTNYSALGEFGFTPICLGFVAAFQSAVQLVQTAHSRIWIGISSINGSTLQTDTPALASGDFVGFRYSTHASDTNFKTVGSSALSATQTVVGTSIPADTAMHTFRVEHGASSYKFFIDGVLVATITTTLPADSTAAFDILQYDAPGTAVGNPGFRAAYIYWWSNQ